MAEIAAGVQKHQGTAPAVCESPTANPPPGSLRAQPAPRCCLPLTRYDSRDTSYEAGSESGGLYIHVPVCRSKCRYCGFYSVPADGVEAGRLVDGLLRELGRYDGVEFGTAYIGGGSPTALPADELLRLARRVRERCPGASEFTVECNPGQVDARLLAGLRAAGVDRLSFGAQSFRASELELLGRGHAAEDIGRSVELARRAGFENLGLDLIFAIPGSTLVDWQYSVEAALRLNIGHVSAYSLSFEAGTVFEAWRRAGRLAAVDEELDRAMYEWAVKRLERAGLEQYEISNFARPGQECRHNLGYWANRPFVGLGPGAASYRLESPRAGAATGGNLGERVNRAQAARAASCDRSPVEPAEAWAGANGRDRTAKSSSPGCPPADAGAKAHDKRPDACGGGNGGAGVTAWSGGWSCNEGLVRGTSRDSRVDSSRTPDAAERAGARARRQGWRVVNDPDIEGYLAAVEAGRKPPGEVEPVSAEDAVGETAVLNLRRRAGIDLAEFQERTGRDALRTFAEPIQRYRDLGLIEVTNHAVRLTRPALPIADTILCDFVTLD